MYLAHNCSTGCIAYTIGKKPMILHNTSSILEVFPVKYGNITFKIVARSLYNYFSTEKNDVNSSDLNLNKGAWNKISIEYEKYPNQALEMEDHTCLIKVNGTETVVIKGTYYQYLHTSFVKFILSSDTSLYWRNDCSVNSSTNSVSIGQTTQYNSTAGFLCEIKGPVETSTSTTTTTEGNISNHHVIYTWLNPP